MEPKDPKEPKNLKEPKEPKKNGGKKPWMGALQFLVALFVVIQIQSFLAGMRVETIPYSEFKQMLAAGNVLSVEIRDGTLDGRYYDGPSADVATFAVRTTPGGAKEEIARLREQLELTFEQARLIRRFTCVRVFDPSLTAELDRTGVRYRGEQRGLFDTVLFEWILPPLLLVVVWLFVMRKMGGMGTDVLSFGKSRHRFSPEATGVTFSDVAGLDEAKEELGEVVEFLRDAARYEKLGAKIPKGVLLVGPPGCGKTLLAKAIAGEANVSFFSISGSDFVEMFVGVGASRVRDLFVQAKAKSPCIIFIDEIDAIGKLRGGHPFNSNDEREQTLNALLVEMDGFEPNRGIILLAATNRPDVLDPALLRPGRFDRQIVVDPADSKGREAILRVHAANKPLATDADLHQIAMHTPGFSGADLANLMNEAALLAARHGRESIAMGDLEEATEKVMAGPERKSRRIGDRERKIIAYHEVGHALVGTRCKLSSPVAKISIVPRGHAALGYTLHLPEEDRYLITRGELQDQIASALGGRAAEELVFRDISSGAQNDLERVTEMAKSMVCRFGMSERIGPISLTQETLHRTYDREEDFFGRSMSDVIDSEVSGIIEKQYARAKEILQNEVDTLHRIAAVLLEKEILARDEFEALLSVAGGGVETKNGGSEPEGDGEEAATRPSGIEQI